jgi:hypothetical protein
MKLGSKKHLQNPKLPTASSNGYAGAAVSRTRLAPKDFVPKKVTAKRKKRK